MQNSSILLLFGATGDLAQKKLFFASFNLMIYDKLPKKFHIAALGRRDYTTSEFRKIIEDKLFDSVSKREQPKIPEFLDYITYHKIDFKNAEDYIKLNKELENIDNIKKIGGNRLFYLAVAPSLFRLVVSNIYNSGLKGKKGDNWSRLVVEKPFGTDLKSAKNYNNSIRKYFDENEILRTDHYLGKEMIRNITSIRFSNPIFMAVWNNKFIDHIQIEVNEEIGIDKRSGYFDKTGIIKDMLQSHILQMVALVVMEKPKSFSVSDVKKAKIEVLKRLKPVKSSDVVIGQYENYRNESGIESDSKTETFIALKTKLKNGSLKNVPIYIRTGKRMPHKTAQIVIVFGDSYQTKSLYPKNEIKNNMLGIHVQPKEGATFCFNSKELGGTEIVRVSMEYCHNCRIDVRSQQAYELIISEAIVGNHDIFTSWDEISYEWKFADNVIKVSKEKTKPLLSYKKGSWGPKEANDLIKNDGREWIELKQ